MAIQYAAGTKVNTTFVPTNKQTLINNVETQLLAAGWTTVSGSGTTNLLMQSATTPQGYAIRIRLKDNAGTCVTFSLESTDGALTGGNSTTVGGAYINPGAGAVTFRIVANKHQAFIWTSPSSVARGFAAFGVPYVPSFLSTVTRVGWMMGNVAFDTDTTVRPSWRTTLQLTVNSNTMGFSAMQVMCNSSLWSLNNNSALQQLGALLCPVYESVYVNATTMNTLAYRWQDLSALLIDPLVAWGEANAGAEAMFKGQLWDAVISTDAYGADLTSTFDTHNWITLTDNNTGASTNAPLRGTILLATS